MGYIGYPLRSERCHFKTTYEEKVILFRILKFNNKKKKQLYQQANAVIDSKQNIEDENEQNAFMVMMENGFSILEWHNTWQAIKIGLLTTQPIVLKNMFTTETTAHI